MYLNTSAIDGYITKDIVSWNRGTALGKAIIQNLFVLPKDNHIIVMSIFGLFRCYGDSRFLPKEVKER